MKLQITKLPTDQHLKIVGLCFLCSALKKITFSHPILENVELCTYCLDQYRQKICSVNHKGIVVILYILTDDIIKFKLCNISDIVFNLL